MSGTLTTRRREALGALAGTAVLPLVAAPASAAPSVVAVKSAQGRDLPFDRDWRFRHGAVPGGEAKGLDDAGWRAVDLPHDWSVEDLPGQDTPFAKDALGEGPVGFTVGGEGWYRKHFKLEGVPANARVEIAFDGIYEIADLWLNGTKLGTSVAGYTPFALDLTPHLERSGDNLLAVRVRNEGKNSRWYAGSGIYREVRLDVLPAGARIARWGVAAWTRRLVSGAADIDVKTAIEAPGKGLQLVTRLRDQTGQVVAQAKSAAQAEVTQTLSVRGPRLWSPGSPDLYHLETELRRGSKVVDRTVQPFGVRIVTFDPVRGMAINGEMTRIRGGCIHHDNGLLGARAFRDADERRVRLMQARGYNAIRSSHNTTSRSLRETCDRLGMLLIDEAFDMWHFPKNPEDFSTRFKEHWRNVLESMIKAGRNSPSVIMWSIGNEIPRRTTAEGIEWGWQLANAARRLDPTRPVTAAIHGTLGPALIAGEATARPGRAGKVDNASAVFLDVPGYNYRLGDIEIEHPEHPERVVYASETFARDMVDYRRLTDKAPYFVGEFLWTALDYIGEAAIGRAEPIKPGTSPYALGTWPYTGANCGDLDLIGEQKPPSLARDVVWGLSPVEVLVHRPLPEGMVEYVTNWGWPDELPSWTWPGNEGKSLAVRVFTAGDRVSVRLNGREVAAKAVADADKMQARIEVPYAAGELEVVATRGGAVIGGKILRTVGAPARLALQAEPASSAKGRQSLIYVPVEVKDGEGRTHPDASVPLDLQIDGPAELLAFGSGDPKWTGSLQRPATRSFRGRALVILRSTGAPGPVSLTVRSPGLASSTTTLRFA